jgi:hypothetical protein
MFHGRVVLRAAGSKPGVLRRRRQVRIEVVPICRDIEGAKSTPWSAGLPDCARVRAGNSPKLLVNNGAGQFLIVTRT